jgi:diguanylate cyclase (GGDEF)-like protein
MSGTHQDISERKRAEEELERIAHTDFLTGLANRRYFLKVAEGELFGALKAGAPLSLLMMDLDFFKKINDIYGHMTGDVVLQKMAALCRGVLRNVDTVGRLGGEEFAVVLPQTDMDGAAVVAERLRMLVAETEVPREHGLPLRFTVSIGIASLPGGVQHANVNIDMLLNQADNALYRAKRDGRNRVCAADALARPGGVETAGGGGSTDMALTH